MSESPHRGPAARRKSSEGARESDRQLHELLDQVHEHLASFHQDDEPAEVASIRTPRDVPSEARAALIASLRTRDVAGVKSACIAIGRSYEHRGKLEAASRCFGTAAILDPSDADAAYQAGRFARLTADYRVSERWFRAAIDRGTAASDWAIVSKAYSGLGNMHRQTGAVADAEGAHMRSLALALKHDLRALRGDGYHNLAILAFESGAPGDGVSYARKALDAYGENRSRSAALASDLAYVWLTHEQSPSRALAIFSEVLHWLDDPIDKLQVLANTARAWSMLQNRHEFDEARAKVDALINQTSDCAGHAVALLDLAHGAAVLSRIRDAHQLARRALSAAESRQETAVASDIRAFLKRLPLTDNPPAPADHGTYVEQQVDELLLELIEALR